jgi:nicotinamidase-related amidase
MRVDVIDPSKTAIIVVDMQNDFIAHGAPMETPAARAVVPILSHALHTCRRAGIRVIFTAHIRRPDRTEVRLLDERHRQPGCRDALIDGTPGADICPELAPVAGERIIKKHRYSAFFETDLDDILRDCAINTVIVSGTTTENCCHATARDAMFRDYRVVFLSDATGTYDYPDLGFGSVTASVVHMTTLAILAASTAHVMSVQDMQRRICG